jgi:hypothetical protein
MAKQAFQVFLSHASADKELARAIVKRISSHGIKVWIDEANIRVGESIPEKIADGLGSSTSICLLFSNAASQSQWVMREFNSFLHEAMTQNKAIIPCRLDETKLPVLIRDLRYADFSGDFEIGMSSLMNAVGIAEEAAKNRRHAEEEKVLQESRDAIKKLIPPLLELRPEIPAKAQLQLLLGFDGRREHRIVGDDKKMLNDFEVALNYTGGGYNGAAGYSAAAVMALKELIAEF